MPRCILEAVINHACISLFCCINDLVHCGIFLPISIFDLEEASDLMAYLALYRKWRPRTFSEVVGQKHISIPLQRAIEQDRLAHAYLFSGPRGTGKTSMAKILAKAVNCEHLEEGNPCNSCEICREINAGASLDVYEIDAASNRGIEEIRALKESVRTLPAACRKKVYIIDEVHMLTKEAFNALLKTLEEPPSHVLFILATTEPEKIPLTILSRCQRYEFHRISVEDIKQHLLYIAKKSGMPLTEDAADLIAVRADGGLRDALSLLDQCSSATEAATLDAAEVYDLLGLTGKDQIIALSHHIFNGESGETLTLFYRILQSGKEPAAILRDLLEHFRNLMICRIEPNAPELSAYGKNIGLLRADAAKIQEAYLDSLFDYLHQSLTETRRSSSPRMSAEMGLLHLCRLKGSAAIDSLAERVSQLEKEIEALKRGKFSGQVPAAAPSFKPLAPVPSFEPPIPIAAPAPESEPVSMMPPPPPLPESQALPQKEPAFAPSPKPKPAEKRNPPSPTPSQPAKATPSEAAPKGESMAPADLLDPATYPAIWQKVLSYFRDICRIDMLTCYQKGVLLYLTPQRAIVSSPQQWLVSAGNNKSYQKMAAEAFQKIIGSPVTLHVVLKGGTEEADALALLAAGKQAKEEKAPVSPVSEASPRKKADPADGYQLVTEKDLKAPDRDDPSLKEALKILPDCDIYEKVTD